MSDGTPGFEHGVRFVGETAWAHVRNFLDAVKRGTRALCDIGPAVRGDTLCQLALIAVKQGRKLQWDSAVERFVNDDGANALLEARPFRGDWQLPAVGGG